MSEKPQHYRPFNFDHAKAGAPVGTITGAPVEILKWNMHAHIAPILAIIGLRQDVVSYTREGKSINAAELVMLPLKMIEGKPVFIGDTLECEGEQGEWLSFVVADYHVNSITQSARWPKPAKEYPKTRMEYEDLKKGYYVFGSENHGLTSWHSGAAENLANAAIARAIEDGDVFTREQVYRIIDRAEVYSMNGCTFTKETKDAIVEEAIHQ